MKQSLSWLFFLVSLAAATHSRGEVEKGEYIRLSKPAYDGKVSVRPHQEEPSIHWMYMPLWGREGLQG